MTEIIAQTLANVYCAAPMRSLILLAALAACTTSKSVAHPSDESGFQATVQWTSDGVPHVTASSFGSLGFGQGWIAASLRLCEIADQIVRVRSERAQFFGPGENDRNLDSDFFHLHLGFRSRARDALGRLSADARAMTHGFALGFNRWLAAHPDAARPAACRGAQWVRPLSDEDLAALSIALATTASSRALEPMIARAAPRNSAATRVPFPNTNHLASNAWAVGAERTTSGGGLLLANPHFPWEGDLQFTELQLTIPGKLDVYGASLVGTVGVQIGFNAHTAWTHTFSSATHFVIYRLPLETRNPLSIAVGKVPDPIIPTKYTTKSLRPDGSLVDVTRTLYRSRWGIMIDAAELPWDPAAGLAYAVKDVAEDDVGSIDMYLGFARARSVSDIEAALAESRTPFVNTIAADDQGDALYMDASRVPALSEEGIAAWLLARRAIPALEMAWQRGLVVLDASMPMFELGGDSHGALRIDSQTPRLRRRDFVMNANDSYVWTHRGVELASNSPLYGDSREPSPRTLANWDLLSVPDKLDRDIALKLLFSNRSAVASRIIDDLLAACNDALTQPCKVLTAWDRKFNVGSRGVVLWRAFLAEIAADGQVPWKRGFDAADVNTPAGLGLGSDVLRAKLANAHARLSERGVDASAPLGDLQSAQVSSGRAGVPGGQELDGVANVVQSVPTMNKTNLPRDPGGVVFPVDFGTSFVMAVDLTKAGPRARVLLTYGNSSDPGSPYYRDQLRMFADGRTREALFTPSQVANDQAALPKGRTERLQYTETR